ncbi:hypothetical protein Aglo01_41490 [Actinokineospora globicatena]|nr:hypothetical protein Aglo01_41490 [Actinokineospora globicatena]GLW85922.1 hypothetical protein Aglo02_35620 [Actinokineospora globicatena]
MRASIGRWVAQVTARATRTLTRESDPRAELAPLTPQFQGSQHEVFVSHLNAALDDQEIRNIAVTGRYGAGKSSVLKEFARQNRKRVLFLSLSTLGPDEPNETKTNQIEKELVKQLLHREKPARVRQSRYQRIERLPKWKAVGQVTGAMAIMAVGLWLFGVIPGRVSGLRADAPAGVRVAASTVIIGCLIWLLAAVRIAIHNRLVVSQVSAAGTAITLTNKSETYFDKYLDEIVYFFESHSAIDVVVFEDLDRFNHPEIFDALRELNTLLNTSKQIIAGRPLKRDQRSVRFIYALRDSIFEQLGHDTKQLADDDAQAEIIRANRTKFFDLVIPLIPFITHRTARELLHKALVDPLLAPVPKVSDELVDLVARHLPDMRLLTNIRNEYSIFANRLITNSHGMDTLTPDRLFALVVYKNLHPEDFELILVGRSRLDRVYQLSRDLVAESTSKRRTRLRQITDGVASQDAIDEKAKKWGERLDWFARKVAAASGGQVTGYFINSDLRAKDQITSVSFWHEIGNRGSGVKIQGSFGYYGNQQTVSLDINELHNLVGDQVANFDWAAAVRDDVLREESELRVDLERLRVADFIDLAKYPEFTLIHSGAPTDFRHLVADIVTSELAQALISSGYIDRYYNMYIAQYYGERLPTNAMSYIVQNVDTNRADITYTLKPNEVAALLVETKRSFLKEVSAYNIDILDHLLKTGDEGAHAVLDNVIRHIGDTERAFIEAYLNDGVHAGDAVAYLAPRWPKIFNELVDSVGLSHVRRVELVDIALANSGEQTEYWFTETIREFFQFNYEKFCTISPLAPTGKSDCTNPTKDAETSEMAIGYAIHTLGRARFECDNLAAVRDLAMRLLVELNCYTFTAANLRVALDQPLTLSLDRVRRINIDVYKRALGLIDEYLNVIDAERLERRAAAPNVVEGEYGASWTIEDPAEFCAIVNDLAELDEQHVLRVLKCAHPSCSIDDLTAVPRSIWTALADCQRFAPTLDNIDAYIEHAGSIDAGLAAILTHTGSITLSRSKDDDVNGESVSEVATERESLEASAIEAVKIRVAGALLNAAATIPDLAVRTMLVVSLDLAAPLPVTQVPAESGPLLGYLLRAGICTDDAATFSHFDTNDWLTLSHGIAHSRKFVEFVQPELLNSSMAKHVLSGSDIGKNIKAAILARVDEFIPVDDRAALQVAGQAALVNNISLSATAISLIARGTQDGNLIVRLAFQFHEALTSGEIIAALVETDEPYVNLTVSGHKLTLPRNRHHEAVFGRLKADGYIKSRVYAKSALRSARIEVQVK